MFRIGAHGLVHKKTFVLLISGLVFIPLCFFDHPYFYFYFTQFVILVLSALLGARYIFYCGGLLAVFFAGFRLGVGVDYYSYVDKFDILRNWDEFSFFEPATGVLVFLAGYVGVGDWFIFLSYSAITIVGVTKLLSVFPRFREISFFIFLTFPIFYLASFNGVRQWAAIGVSCFVISYLVRNKVKAALFCAGVAVTLHASAVALFSLFFLQRRFKLRTILSLFMLVPAFSIIAVYSLEFTPYDIYLGDGGLRFDGGSYYSLYAWALALFYIPVRLGYFDKNKFHPPGVILLCNMNFASLMVISVGLYSGFDFLTFMRVNNYFIVQLLVLFPLFLMTLKGLYKVHGFVFFVLSLTGYLIVTIAFNGESYYLTPYKNVIFS